MTKSEILEEVKRVEDNDREKRLKQEKVDRFIGELIFIFESEISNDILENILKDWIKENCKL